MTTTGNTPDTRNSVGVWLLVLAVAAVLVAALVWLNSGGGGDPQQPAPGAAPQERTTASAEDPVTAAPEDVQAVTSPPTMAALEERTVAVDEEGERLEAAVVDPTDVAEPSDAVEVRVAEVEEVTGEVTIPGEVEGPALRVTVELTNDGAGALDTAGAVANAYYGEDRTPAGTFLKPGGRPLPSQVAAGDTVSGVYLFDIPEGERADVSLEIDVAPELRVVVFEGGLGG